MGRAVYNSAIPSLILNTANRFWSSACLLWLLRFFLVLLATAVAGLAADWSAPEQQLARKIAAVTGPGAVALSVENRSSLGRRDSDIVQNGLRGELEALGLRFVKPEQAAATVSVSLSESSQSYVWVAEIRQGSESTAVMVSAPRPEGLSVARDSVPLNLNKIPLWTQDEPILDIAVLEENPTPAQIAVLDPEKVTLYRMQGGKWQLQQALEISHARPWPRDLRGRLIPRRDHLLDAYLPGVTCAASSTAPLTLICHDSDDPWPLTSETPNGNGASIFPSGAQGAVPGMMLMKAFFTPTRDFFTGAVNPAIGKFTTVPKFYSAAVVPREKYTLWLFAATDGTTHLVDGMNDQATRMGWGSDVASVKTSCGAGWQVLATSSGDLTGDTVRAYEFPDRDAVAVTAPIDLPGPVTALWTESRNDTAVAVTRNRETGSYEAFRLALGCSQ